MSGDPVAACADAATFYYVSDFLDGTNGISGVSLSISADGGRSWESWFDRTANPKFFNLYAIRPAGGGLFIAGEGGLLLKLDGAGQQFNALTVPSAPVLWVPKSNIVLLLVSDPSANTRWSLWDTPFTQAETVKSGYW